MSRLHRLKEKSAVPFPEALRRAIIAKNHPVLRRVIPSYLHQIEKAIRRNDLVSINHRVAALLASYFDVLFALNRIPNPGEKRLLKTASECCTRIPGEMVNQVEAVLRAVCSADQSLIVRIEELLDGLDQLLLEEGVDLETSRSTNKVTVQRGGENTRQDLRGLRSGALLATLNGTSLAFQAKSRPKPRRSERLPNKKSGGSSYGERNEFLPRPAVTVTGRYYSGSPWCVIPSERSESRNLHLRWQAWPRQEIPRLPSVAALLSVARNDGG